jgi:hypothetical protein
MLLALGQSAQVIPDVNRQSIDFGIGAQRELHIAAVSRAFASGRRYVLNVDIRGARSPFPEWQIAGKR